MKEYEEVVINKGAFKIYMNDCSILIWNENELTNHDCDTCYFHEQTQCVS